MKKTKLSYFLLTVFTAVLATLTVFAAPVQNAKTTRAREIHISTREELKEFTQNCHLDSYSENLKVYLDKDIDLSHIDFDGVPIFGGKFYGQGHTIKGLFIHYNGSYSGFFRYLAKDGEVMNLNLEGYVEPTGSGDYAGGFAGKNDGKITDCSFKGAVTGTSNIGLIAGINTENGTINGCSVTGRVSGDSCAGGIAGTNAGIIRACTANALTNTTADENEVNLSDITVSDIGNISSAAGSTTDIGGIAGRNTGVIRSCQNTHDIGYIHIGYNIGGIAGSSSGLVIDCTNYGDIKARKEAGGIVGQMEPFSHIIYSEDYLKKIRRQIETINKTVESSINSADSYSDSIKADYDNIHSAANSAIDNINDILNEAFGSQTLPIDPNSPLDPDFSFGGETQSIEISSNGRINALSDALTENLKSIISSFDSIRSKTSRQADAQVKNANALNSRVTDLSNTVADLSEMSISKDDIITDDSKLSVKTEESGKIMNCTNYGEIFSDINSGGIAGAMAFENDLDPEDDLDIVGSFSLSVKMNVKSVIYNSTNYGKVAAKKENMGGIAGCEEVGLITDCYSYGDVDSKDVNCAGGIAGLANSDITNCYVKTTVRANNNVGGIVGYGNNLSNNYAMITIDSQGENRGAIAGNTADDAEIENNCYLKTKTVNGAIDEISYDGKAQSMAYEDFIKIKNLPETMTHLTYRFTVDGKTIDEIDAGYGDIISDDDLPAIPGKDDTSAHWREFNHVATENVTVEAVYVDVLRTIEYRRRDDEEDKPFILAEGNFDRGARLMVNDLTPAYSPLEDETVVQQLSLVFPDQNQIHTVRILGDKYTKIYEKGEKGFKELETEIDGSYLVFKTSSNPGTIAIVTTPAPDFTFIIVIAIAVAVALLLIVIIKNVIKKAKSKKATKGRNSATENNRDTKENTNQNTEKKPE